jgi:hypothetical protein
VTVPASTTTATTLNYNLISVRDATTITEQTSSGSAIVTVSSPPAVDFTFTNDSACSGTAIQFSSSVTGSYIYLRLEFWRWYHSPLNKTHHTLSIPMGVVVLHSMLV